MTTFTATETGTTETDTSGVERLWAALVVRPDATAAALAAAVDQPREQVAASLAAWHSEGHVTRSGRGVSARWQAADQPTDASATDHHGEDTVTVPDQDDTEPENTDDSTDDSTDADGDDEDGDEDEDGEEDEGAVDDPAVAQARLLRVLLAAAGSDVDALAAQAGVGADDARRMVAAMISSDEERVWDALCAHPEGSTETIATVADVDPGATRRMLTGWARGPRPAVVLREIWVAAPDVESPARAGSAGRAVAAGTPSRPRATATVSAAGSAAGSATVSSGTARPASGSLMAEVTDYLRQNPDPRGYTPTELAHALGGRSSGSTGYTCNALADKGVAVLVSERPKRYTLADGQ